MSDFFDDDEAEYWRSQWNLAPGVSYLNHGSFGPPPRPVQVARRVGRSNWTLSRWSSSCGSSSRLGFKAGGGWLD